MMLNYYLTWLHFDKYGRMTTRLPEGHRVLNVIHESGSNRHSPALWVLVEAVAATPAYTPAAGFPAAYSQQPPAEYPQPSGPVPGSQAYYNKYYSDGPADGAAQNGGGDSLDSYRADDYAPGVPMSPVNR